MKKVITILLIAGILTAGCAPDGAYLGAMVLKTNVGPFRVDEVIPSGGLIWLFDKPKPQPPPSELQLFLDAFERQLNFPAQ